MGYRLVYDQVFSAGAGYKGASETCAATFEGTTTVEALAQATVQKVTANGGTPLRLIIYYDSTSNRWKTFTYAHGSPGLLWAIIILAIVAACLIALITWAVKTVSPAIGGMIWGPGYIAALSDYESGEPVNVPWYSSIPWLPVTLIGGACVLVYLYLRKGK